MASVIYNNGKAALLKNDMDGVTLKAILFDPAYTPDIDAEIYLDDVSANRAANSTDITLTSVTITVNNTDDTCDIDFADIVTAAITTSYNAYGVYISTGVDSTSELIGYIETTDGVTTPKTFTSVGGVNTITIPTGGAIKVT